MCKPGNGTIYAECRDRALQSMRRTHATNAEMRQVIKASNDECLMSWAEEKAKFAQTPKPMLVS